MSKSEKQVSGVSGQVSAGVKRPIVLMLLCASAFLFAGCRQDMQNQPRYKPYRASGFFRDNLSSRPLVEGTIPRGYLRDDTLLYTGKATGTQVATQRSETNSQQQSVGQNRQTGENAAPQPGSAQSNPAMTPAGASSTSGAQNAGASSEADSTVFPFPVTEQVLERGQGRYQIFCSVCHGMTGDGDGMVVRRGYRKPPSYYDPRLRGAPVGHFFDVMTNGWGAMPNYAQQIPATDRWAIIAYIRALQASRPQVGADAQTGAQPQQQPSQTGGQR